MLMEFLIQGAAFFALFQPGLLMRKAERRLALSLVLTISAMILIFSDVDPFTWLMYTIVLFLVYRTARNALSWAFQHRYKSRQRVQAIEKELERLSKATLERQGSVTELERGIEKVSKIYERLKEMSGSLDTLGIFINFSQAVLESVSVSRVKILILDPEADNEKVIHRVYQMDRERLNFTPRDRMMMSDDVMFRGELYPSDVRILECIRQENKPVYFPAEESAHTSPESGDRKGSLGLTQGLSKGANAQRLIPGLESPLMSYPISTEKGLEAVLIMEDAQDPDLDIIGILSDRYTAEYKRVKLYQGVQRLATTDWLTNLYVRRYFFSRLEEEIKRCERYNLIFSFLMVDIDDFKKHNDHFGHLVGDAILKEIAQVISENVREVDLVGRYGGEEFSAILIDTDADQAMYIAERIRKGVEKHAFRIYDEELHLTVSVGFATYNSKISDANEMVEWADSSLYQAKRQGKNRVCAYIPRRT